MADPNLHLTQSHLLRRLLQRRVERLEVENVGLKTQIAQLEERLTHSTQRHPVLAGSAEETIQQAAGAVRELGERLQAETEATDKLLAARRTALGEEWARLVEQAGRLTQALFEAGEAVQTLEEQGRSSAALLQREANLQQEQLTGEVEGLYNEDGTLQFPVVQVRRAALLAQERATQEGDRLASKAQRERARLLGQIEGLSAAIVRLRAGVARATEQLHTLSRLSAAETSHALQAEVEPLPTPEAAPPPVVPMPPTAKRRTSMSHHRADDTVLQAARAAFAVQSSTPTSGARAFEARRATRLTPTEADSPRQPITTGHAPILVAHTSLDPTGTAWTPWLLFATFLFVILALALIFSQVLTL